MRLKILAVPNMTQLYTEQEWEQFVSTIKCLQGLANFAEAYLRMNKVSELLEKIGLVLQSLYEKISDPDYSLTIQDLQPLDSSYRQFHQVTNDLIYSLLDIYGTDKTPKFRFDSYSNRIVKTSSFAYDLIDKLGKSREYLNGNLRFAIRILEKNSNQIKAKESISMCFNKVYPYTFKRYGAYLSLLKDIQDPSLIDTMIDRKGFESYGFPQLVYTEFLYPYIRIMRAKNLSV